MRCPRCGDETLYPMSYADLVVDRCSQCRGIWLDTGELLEVVRLSLPLLRRAKGRPVGAGATARLRDEG
jgi:Zn-finger nucleic acid-binding protein